MVELKTRPWLAKYPDDLSKSLDYGDRPLHDYLKESAGKYPNKIAIHFLGKTISFKSLYTQAIKFANQLKKMGLSKGDRVAVMLPNSPQSVIAYYGVLMLGGVVVQTNPLYTERELQHQLVDSGARVILCIDMVLSRVIKVKETEKTSIEHIISTSIQDYLPFPKNLLYPLTQGKKQKIEKPDKVFSFKHLVKSGETTPLDVSISPEDDLALLQYTGGTTGPAKGVMLTHLNLIANTKQTISWMYKTEYGKESILGVLPFFHVYGMTIVMNLSIMYAAKMILLPRFKVEEVLKTIEREKPTLFPGAPTMYIAMIHHPDVNLYDLSSIDACISGSAPLPHEVQEKFEQITNGKLVEGYGLTEASPVTHCNLLWEKRISGSIGLPYPDTDAAVYSAETNALAGPNEVGELVVKGPQVMKGYWNNPEETEAVFQDEWLFTGDMAYMDENGYFYIVDRKKDMIIASGYNIYPREVEEVLYEHPDIREAAVIGVPDPYRGETVKAFIVLKEGQSISEEELDQYCRKYLAAYKVPHLYEFRQELPKTTVGKILRRTLLDEERKNKELI